MVVSTLQLADDADRLPKRGAPAGQFVYCGKYGAEGELDFGRANRILRDGRMRD
jgi:hypothetical protein